MRIAIDARMMGPETTRGIGRYIEELIAAMLAIAPEHRYVLVTRIPDHRFANHPSVETVVVHIPWYGLREQIEMPQIFAKLHSDVLHIPHWNVPILVGRPFIVTIHDLILLHDPDSAKASTRSLPVRWGKRLGYRAVLRHAIQNAEKILVPTVWVARDIIADNVAAVSKICVTGEGMPRINIQGSNVEYRDPSDLNFSSPYLLYVGSAYPHKGLQDVLSAWSMISKIYPKLCLKIAGGKDVFMQRQEARTIREGLKRIFFYGRVSEDELVRLYDGAIAFVYPSHFEGFGLPPLEALARGCPVISSDAGPLPEVLGKGGVIFFRSGDETAILSAVRELMRDPCQVRRDAVQLGPSLAVRHDWKQAAMRTLGAYGDPHYHCATWHEG